MNIKELYLNSELSGHSLLEPSIWVKNSYRRVFSPIAQSGYKALTEVITRIALFIILPLAAVVSTLGIPFGLLIKSLDLSSWLLKIANTRGLVA